MEQFVEIPLSKDRGSALIDAEDAERVLGHRWFMTSNGYVATSRRHGDANETVLLHRLLLGLERGDRRQVDHIDGNRMDCRRCNMRIVTAAQNRQNQTPVRDGCVSRFRGVSLHRKTGMWVASAQLDGRSYHLGLFRSEEDAAETARRWRVEHMPYAARDAVA